MNLNRKMQNLLDTVASKSYDVQMSEIISKDILHPKVKKIYECILVDLNDELAEEKINLERVLRFHGDRTGYEASINETRVNDYLLDNNYNEGELALIGSAIVEYWKKMLNVKFPKYDFVFIMVIREGYLTLRFYTKRENESEWLSKDIESYNEAVGVL